MKTDSEGLAALMIVIVVGAAALLIGVSSMLLGLGELDMGQMNAGGGAALAMTEGCADETLKRIRMDSAYGVGLGTLSLVSVEGSCSVVVSDLGSNQRQVVVTGTVGAFVKRVVVVLTLNGSGVGIDDWSEV